MARPSRDVFETLSDEHPPPVARKVLDFVSSIPAGRVMSYGAIAMHLGAPGPRAIGRVMKYWSEGVPWWRVVRSSGGFAPEVAQDQEKWLRAEGVAFRAKGRIDMAASRYVPDA
jgi:alkylated DNA nucleotide flippase Atl1